VIQNLSEIRASKLCADLDVQILFFLILCLISLCEEAKSVFDSNFCIKLLEMLWCRSN